MAKQAINIGTTANDGTGDPIRSAFDKVNDNEDELYEGANITATAPLAKTSVADTSVTLAISDDGITATQLAVSGNGSAGQVLTSDADGTFSWASGISGDVDSVNAGTGISVNQTTGSVTVTNSSPNATHTGDVTGSGALTIADDAVVTAKILDANVTLAKIANAAANTVIVRDANSSGVLSAKAVASTELLIGDGTGFTAASLSGDTTMTNAGVVTIANDAVTSAKMGAEYTTSDVLSPSSSVDCEANDHDIFTLAIDQATVVNFTGVVAGMSKTVVVTGNGTHSPTLTNINSSTGTFNRISGTYSTTSSTKNFIQLKFVSTSEAWYTISQIAS